MSKRENSKEMAASETERIHLAYAGYRDTGYATRWSVSNPGNQAIIRERSARMHRLLKDGGFGELARCAILEIGCGSGAVLRTLIDMGATPERLHGIDLLPDRIEEARRELPNCHFAVGNAETLPYASARFDLVIAFTVFSSILNRPMARKLASEVTRVLKPGGGVLWFDVRVNNPWNRDVHGIRRADVVNFYPGFQGQFFSLTLLPPLARRLGLATGWMYPLLASVPLLRTHLLGLLLKPGCRTS